MTAKYAVLAQIGEYPLADGHYEDEDSVEKARVRWQKDYPYIKFVSSVLIAGSNPISETQYMPWNRKRLMEANKEAEEKAEIAWANDFIRPENNILFED